MENWEQNTKLYMIHVPDIIELFLGGITFMLASNVLKSVLNQDADM